jgi:hypothetical protein
MDAATKKAIIATLRKLASAIPSFAPDFSKQEVCEVWLENVSDIAPERFGAACKEAIHVCETFPSVAKIRALAGTGQTSDKELAEQVADTIWNSLRFGADNPGVAYAHMGELSATVARRLGSWYDLCMRTQVDQESFVKKRWCSVAQQYLAEHRSGTIGSVPALNQSTGQTALLERGQNGHIGE